MPNKFNLGFQSSVTPIMEGIIDLHNHIFFFLVLVFVFVFWIFGNILYHFWWQVVYPSNWFQLRERIILARFRHLSHSTFLEVVWTIVPSLILVAIAIPSFSLLYAMDEIMEPSLTLKVVGHQWYWSYEYSDCLSPLRVKPTEHHDLVPQSFWEKVWEGPAQYHRDLLQRRWARGFWSWEDYDSQIRHFLKTGEVVGDPRKADLFSNRNPLNFEVRVFGHLKKIMPEDIVYPPDWDLRKIFRYIEDEPIPAPHQKFVDLIDWENDWKTLPRVPNFDYLASINHLNEVYKLPKADLFLKFLGSRDLLWEKTRALKEVMGMLSSSLRLVDGSTPLPTVRFDSYMLSEDELLRSGDYRLLEVDEPIVLPVDTQIRLLITADDVIHSFAVPQLGIKVDAVPGRLNQQAVFLRRRGTFYGQCSELCGVNHGFMPIVVKGVSMKEFILWYIQKFNSLYPDQSVNLVDPAEIDRFLVWGQFPEVVDHLNEARGNFKPREFEVLSKLEGNRLTNSQLAKLNLMFSRAERGRPPTDSELAKLLLELSRAR